MKNTKPFLIVSDVHLGAVPRSTEHAFRDFLGYVEDAASGLLINGDLFDFWFEYRSVVPREHFRVLVQLAGLVDAGVPVSFIGGNHDAWGGDFLRREIGVELLNGPVELALAGRRALVAHGDGIGRGDIGYRALRTILRSRATIGAFRLLHPDLGSKIAQIVSTTEKKAGNENGTDLQRAERIQTWATQRLEENPGLDLVVAGHVHHPKVAEVLPGRFYVNAGDWINNYTYVTLDAQGGNPELHRWPHSR